MTTQLLQAASIIRVQSGSSVYVDTPDNFAADYGQAAPSLPEGIGERLYEPGVRHPLSTSGDVLAGGDMPWTFGDDVIADLSNIIVAKSVRENAPIPEDIEPEFGSVPPRLSAQILSISVADGDVQQVKGAFNAIGMFYEEMGLYTLYFINEQPDTQYFVHGAGVVLRETDKQVDYVTVEALDANGSRFDPLRFGINVYRT
jgi:hypothetical protein